MLSNLHEETAKEMKITKKREQDILQLLNDIAEDMDLKRWTKQDYRDAISYLQDESEDAANRFNSYHCKVLIAVTELIEYPKPKK